MRNSSFQPSSKGKAAFLIILFLSFIARGIMAIFPKIATTYGDELLYLELAQNIWLHGSLTVYAIPAQFSKLFYPLLLSPFYAISDSGARLTAISLFNAFLVSSSLIPAYLLGKRFLKKNSSLVIALLVLALSPHLCFSMTYMAENLYLPLFLWTVWLLMRALDPSKQSFFHSLILGFFIFLLYATKESGIAFLGAVSILELELLFTEKERRNHHLLSFGCLLIGFFLPFLICHFVLFHGFSFSYAVQLSRSSLNTPQALVFLLYSALVMILYFLVSGLFFPVLVPLSQQKALDSSRRKLLILSCAYLLLIALGTSYAVSLAEDFENGNLRIHLRYFLPVLYPFLLLFLSLLEESGYTAEDHSLAESQPFSDRKRSLIVLSLISFALVLLLPRALSFGSLVDAPSLYAVKLSPDGSLWLRIICVAAALLCLIFWGIGKQKAFTLLCSCMIIALELTNSFSFIRDLRFHEAFPGTTSMEEVKAMDHLLDQLDGPVLVIRDDIHLPNERAMDSWTNDNYYVAESTSILDLSYYSKQPGSIHLRDTVLPTPVHKFLTPTRVERLPYLVTSSSSVVIVSDLYNTDITPETIQHWRIYKAADPEVIHLQDPIAYNIGDPLIFYGTAPTYLKYLVLGFSNPEPGFTWTDGNYASIMLNPIWDSPRDLTAEIVIFATMGTQPIQIFANNQLVYEGVLDGWSYITFPVPKELFTEHSEYGAITFDFHIPDAITPNNGDPRQLGLAFESFILHDNP